MTLIRERYTDFVDLCRSHKVDKIYAFGSSITDQFDPKTSDIDIVVTVDIDDPVDRGEALISLWDKLEALFKRKVDLLTEDSIRNPYLKSNINRTKKLIYDRVSRPEIGLHELTCKQDEKIRKNSSGTRGYHCGVFAGRYDLS